MKVFTVFSLFVFLCCLEVALSYPRPATAPDGVGRAQSCQSTHGHFAYAAYENLGVYCQSFTWFLYNYVKLFISTDVLCYIPE